MCVRVVLDRRVLLRTLHLLPSLTTLTKASWGTTIAAGYAGIAVRVTSAWIVPVWLMLLLLLTVFVPIAFPLLRGRWFPILLVALRW